MFVLNKIHSTISRTLFSTFSRVPGPSNQININLYLTEATTLHHSEKVVDLWPSWRAFNPISIFNFPDFKINFISLILSAYSKNSC
jgi:hypothetical protein